MKLIKLNLVDNVWNELTEGGKNPRTANKVRLINDVGYTPFHQIRWRDSTRKGPKSPIHHEKTQYILICKCACFE